MQFKWQRLGMVLCATLWLGACASKTTVLRPTPTASLPAPVQLSVNHAAPVDPDAVITNIIGKMTLDQKIGQLLMVEFLGSSYNSYIDGMVHAAHAGGVLIYNWEPANDNLRTLAQQQTLDAAIQTHGDFPMFIAMDQEGGEVDHLALFQSSPYSFPSALAIANTGDPANAEKAGKETAKLMLGIGINVNLAPVVDIQGASGSFEGTRVWADTPDKTDQYAGAFLAGSQSQGMIGTLKHWPGIGGAPCTPDYCLPTLSDSADRVTNVDMAAFKGLLPQGPAMIMTTCIIVPSIDPTHPITFSSAAINDDLRGKLGYQGVVITDALHAQGVYSYLSRIGISSYPASLEEATVEAVLAGNDVLEGGFDPSSAIYMLDALRSAVNSGRIPLARIEESDRRILRLKLSYGIGTDRLLAAAGMGS